MGRAPCCEKVGLKKGRWTAEEDQLLVNYIKANGEGSWRSLPKNAGLLRCGKSCRLRWINYLREDLKRGNITLEEEDTIIKLQATLGNRWSLIAGHLPGRTDNEIKNYWNSHLSKKAQGLADDDEGDQSAGPEKTSSSSGKRKRGAAGCKESTATKKKKKRSSSSTNNNNNNLYGKTKDTATKKQQKKSMSSLGATTGANKDSDSTLTSTDPTADDGMLQTSGDGSPGVDGPDLLHELEKEEEEEEKEEEGVAQDSVGLLGAVTAPSKEVAVGGSQGEGEGRAMSSLTEEKDVGRATTSITMSSSSEETSSTNRANLGLDGINGRAMKAGGGQEEESFNFEGFENLPWEEAGDMWKWNWLWDGQELDIQQPNLGFDLSEDNLESWLFSDIL